MHSWKKQDFTRILIFAVQWVENDSSFLVISNFFDF